MNTRRSFILAGALSVVAACVPGFVRRWFAPKQTLVVGLDPAFSKDSAVNYMLSESWSEIQGLKYRTYTLTQLSNRQASQPHERGG